MKRCRPGRLAALLLAPALLVAAGCSGSDEADEPAAAGATSATSATSPAGTPSPTPTASVTPSATATPEPTPSSQAPEEPSTAGGLPDALLTADQMPGFNAQYTWSPGRTRSKEPSVPIGTCHRFDLLSIGATEVRHRTFTPPAGDGSMAQQAVAAFADPETARRAYQTLLAWRKSCPEVLKSYPRSDVSLFEDVPVVEGEAGWWLAAYGPVGDDPNEAAFDAEGIALVGDRIAVVHLVSYGQDYIYDDGQEPAAVAIRRAAEQLG